MIKNYFKIAWRNMVNSKGYSAINIGGLAVGMAVAMMIGLWMYDELSFNKYHQQYEKIGQIRELSTKPSGVTDGGDNLPIPMGAALKDNYKHFFDKVLISWWVQDYTISFGEKKLKKTGQFAEPGIAEMLSLKMLKGNYAGLQDPHSIILSRSAAEAIFGSNDPINQSLRIDNRMDVTVTGVYEDVPKNSTFGEVQFFSPWALWVSSNEWVKDNVTSWNNTSFHIYVQLQPNVSMQTAQAGVKDFYLKNGPKDLSGTYNKSKPELLVYPMIKWHLFSEFKDGRPAGGRITFVWLFGITGLFVLILACINFINLSTARSQKRAKEVGIRKAIGSVRRQLISQFLSESFLVVLLAFLLSCGIVVLSLSWFNTLADKNISLPFGNGIFWLAALVFMLLTGFLAGLYPAFYLSSFQPIKVLKGTINLGRFSSLPRKTLVVVQFTVSVVLIIGTIVVYQQIQYARNRPMGYNNEGLVSISLNDPNYKDKHDVIKAALMNTGMVSDMALSNSPLTEMWNRSGFTWEGKAPETESGFNTYRVTHDFGKMVEWKFIAGRNFSKAFATDSAGVILNETAANYIGLKDPVGKFIKSEDGTQAWQITGVIKDMLMQSPYEPVSGTFYFLDNNYKGRQLVLKISSTASAGKALSAIETVLKKIVPSAYFDYKFVDEEYAKKFSQEQRIGKLATVFAILAIFISCLGLFGLASFVAEQRTKEIGIRKVLGATVTNLWQLLSKDFVLLVITACIIATPIASYCMNNWLQKYTYRTNISWWIFAAAGIGALTITLLTVSFQAIKTALMQPVKSLKGE